VYITLYGTPSQSYWVSFAISHMIPYHHLLYFWLINDDMGSHIRHTLTHTALTPVRQADT